MLQLMALVRSTAKSSLAKETSSMNVAAEEMMHVVGHALKFFRNWRKSWKKIKDVLKKGKKILLTEKYKHKELQSATFS